MAVQFLIDAVTMPYDPNHVEWEPKELLDTTHAGGPIYNIKRTCRLKFDVMAVADFNTIAAYDDGATHTVKIPRPTDGTYTSYAGVYIRPITFPFEDINVHAPEFIVWWITL